MIGIVMATILGWTWADLSLIPGPTPVAMMPVVSPFVPAAREVASPVTSPSVVPPVEPLKDDTVHLPEPPRNTKPSPAASKSEAIPRAAVPTPKPTLHYATDRFGKRWSSPDEAWLKQWVERVNKGQAR